MDNYIFVVTIKLGMSTTIQHREWRISIQPRSKLLDLIFKQHYGLQLQLHFSNQIKKLYHQEIILMLTAAFIEPHTIDFQ